MWNHFKTAYKETASIILGPKQNNQVSRVGNWMMKEGGKDQGRLHKVFQNEELQEYSEQDECKTGHEEG